MRAALTMCLCAPQQRAAMSARVSCLPAATVRGPVLRLNSGIFEAQHCSHFDGSGSDNACIVLTTS